MSDEELIAQLRGSCFLAFDDGTNEYASALDAADRIEALARKLNEVNARAEAAEARAERLEAALRIIGGNNCITCSAVAFNALFAERHPIAALPAVTVGVKPLVFTEARNKMWNAQHGYRIGWNHDDRYRVKLVDRVICKSIKGFDAAVDWANKHNEARILAALETVTQPALAAMTPEVEALVEAIEDIRDYATILATPKQHDALRAALDGIKRYEQRE